MARHTLSPDFCLWLPYIEWCTLSEFIKMHSQKCKRSKALRNGIINVSLKVTECMRVSLSFPPTPNRTQSVSTIQLTRPSSPLADSSLADSSSSFSPTPSLSSSRHHLHPHPLSSSYFLPPSPPPSPSRAPAKQ